MYTDHLSNLYRKPPSKLQDQYLNPLLYMNAQPDLLNIDVQPDVAKLAAAFATSFILFHLWGLAPCCCYVYFQQWSAFLLTYERFGLHSKSDSEVDVGLLQLRQMQKLTDAVVGIIDVLRAVVCHPAFLKRLICAPKPRYYT